MITIDGIEIEYIPVTIGEGEESAPYTLRVTPENAGEELKAEAVDGLALWGKIGAGAYQELAVTPLDLSGFYPGFADVLVKVIAANSIPGVTRKYIFLGTETGGAALW